MHNGKSEVRLGRTREMPQNFSTHPHCHNQTSIQQGQRKIKEIEKGERSVENPKQAIVVSTMKRKEERHSSPSFDWMHEPPTKAYHNKQAESTRQQGNNAKLIEMLDKMDQSMKERDNQLKAQNR